MAVQRRANAVWQGALQNGSGTITQATSGALSNLPVSWAARTEEPNGKTSPEELVAAAHASCFSMALSAGLGRGGTPPEQLDVSATVTFDNPGDGFRVVSSVLEVRGRVPNLDQKGFEQAAEAAKDGCPISKALKGNVELSVKATLDT